MNAIGEHDRALELYRRDVLPGLDRFGTRSDVIYAQGNFAYALILRGRTEDRAEAATLLKQAIAGADAMGLPSAQWFRDLKATHGL